MNNKGCWSDCADAQADLRLCCYIRHIFSWPISCFFVIQIKRTIRKKHILPNYKMRFKPVFMKTEDSRPAPAISCKGTSMSQGLLLVNVMGCTRLTGLPSDCRLYCTLSVGRYCHFICGLDRISLKISRLTTKKIHDVLSNWIAYCFEKTQGLV